MKDRHGYEIQPYNIKNISDKLTFQRFCPSLLDSWGISVVFNIF